MPSATWLCPAPTAPQTPGPWVMRLAQLVGVQRRIEYTNTSATRPPHRAKDGHISVLVVTSDFTFSSRDLASTSPPIGLLRCAARSDFLRHRWRGTDARALRGGHHVEIAALPFSSRDLTSAGWLSSAAPAIFQQIARSESVKQRLQHPAATWRSFPPHSGAAPRNDRVEIAALGRRLLPTRPYSRWLAGFHRWLLLGEAVLAAIGGDMTIVPSASRLNAAPTTSMRRYNPCTPGKSMHARRTTCSAGREWICPLASLSAFPTHWQVAASHLALEADGRDCAQIVIMDGNM
ncbi:hypothetical protein C8R47DRAFT_1075682 [Mycena vitilis]|nr:hypothetical protein C8R47DRAFT_1075682 [Mycena vitilis]